MSTVLLFHHAQGPTSGFLAFADRLRRAGHTVETPDLYDGNTFESLDEGLAYVRRIGFDEILRQGRHAAETMPSDLVYGGFSLGVLPAQSLAQTRPGARGALLYHACFPPEEFGGDWPRGLPAQIHMMRDDPFGDEDLPAAQALALAADDVELFVYPGSGHLFADASVEDYDAGAAGLLEERTLTFLDRVG
jgi:dienelactone hydrolase